MGVSGIVLGGVLDKELRDFEATQARRRDVGGVRGDFAVLLLEGYGKVGLDPGLFAWFREHDGHMASLFGSEALLYVYDAAPPPIRRSLLRPGDRVIAHRRPYAGQSGTLHRAPTIHAPSAAASERPPARGPSSRSSARSARARRSSRRASPTGSACAAW
jgi:hypothetical protein